MAENGVARPSRRVAVRHVAADSPIATDLGELARLEHGWRRCPIYRNATQAVPGEGPADAPLMLVGEQPGSEEDLSERPFVGPAGRLLAKALDRAGIDRSACFVTNAVKHFKFESRGKRRLHKKPDAGEIDICRWWLDQERSMVRPSLIVALGASAARGVTGRTLTIGRVRGQVMTLDDGANALVTVHPPYLLRIDDAAAKEAEWSRFLADLGAAKSWLDSSR